MAEIQPTLATTVESTEHLLKAVIALLALKDPQFLSQLDRVFTVAAMHDSPIAHMRDESWVEMLTELRIIGEFLPGAGLPSESAPDIDKAH